jgi:hypothetical protein
MSYERIIIGQLREYFTPGQKKKRSWKTKTEIGG